MLKFTSVNLITIQAKFHLKDEQNTVDEFEVHWWKNGATVQNITKGDIYIIDFKAVKQQNKLGTVKCLDTIYPSV